MAGSDAGSVAMICLVAPGLLTVRGVHSLIVFVLVVVPLAFPACVAPAARPLRSRSFIRLAWGDTAPEQRLLADVGNCLHDDACAPALRGKTGEERTRGARASGGRETRSRHMAGGAIPMSAALPLVRRRWPTSSSAPRRPSSIAAPSAASTAWRLNSHFSALRTHLKTCPAAGSCAAKTRAHTHTTQRKTPGGRAPSSSPWRSSASPTCAPPGSCACG